MPDGALLISVTLHACDTNLTANVGAFLVRFNRDGGSPMSVGGGATTGMPGCVPLVFPLPPLIVDNALTHLVIFVITDAGDLSTSFSSLGITYTLPPPPATQSFGDVPPSHPFYRYIEEMYRRGLTAGCGGGNFCPARALTRGEEAVFIIRSKFSGD